MQNLATNVSVKAKLLVDFAIEANFRKDFGRAT